MQKVIMIALFFVVSAGQGCQNEASAPAKESLAKNEPKGHAHGENDGHGHGHGAEAKIPPTEAARPVEKGNQHQGHDHAEGGHDHGGGSAHDHGAGKSDTVASPTEKTVEVGCGMCIYKMEGVKKCTLAAKIDGNPVLVEGTVMMDHGDAHSKDGMCNTTRQAVIDGKMKGDKFFATKFKLLPKK